MQTCVFVFFWSVKHKHIFFLYKSFYRPCTRRTCWTLRNAVFVEICAGWSQQPLRQAHTCDWTLNTNCLNL